MNKMNECSFLSFFTLFKLLMQGGVNPLREETDQEIIQKGNSFYPKSNILISLLCNIDEIHN